MALTIRDIAELAGVSRGTVDRVLHNRGRVDPAVASRIRKIMEECGYRPSLAAKQLALRHQKNKIGFISKIDYNGFWSIVNRNAEEAEKMLAEYGIAVEKRFFDFCLPDMQLKLIDELVEEGINALVIVPLESKDIVNRLQELSDRGIPVILLNSELTGFEPLCYIGSDYYVGGKTAAGLLHNFSKASSLKILLMNGSNYLSSQILRRRGFIDEITSLDPDCEIIESGDITSDPEYAFRAAKEMLEKHPEINAVYTIPDNAAAVANAIQSCGRTGSLVHIGFSMTDATRPYILDGSISALIGPRAMDQGRMPFEILLDFFATGDPPADRRILMLNDIFIRQNSIF